MKLSIAALLLASVSTTTFAGGVHWAYKGDHGAKHWAQLSSEFSTCSTGVNQSPIDITSSIEAQLPTLGINYSDSKIEVVNNGHTIQANLSGKNTFANDAGQFDLLQFHFHSPSENTIDGKSFPMEAHFVHADAQGRLAVIGVMFTEGASNAELERVWDVMPTKSNTKNALVGMLNSGDLLPTSQDYFRFNGSLTTPPCSEGVRWFVMKNPIEASKAQIKKFRKVLGGDTNRPVQPINARVVLK